MLTICGCLLCCRFLFGVFCCCRRVQDNDYRKGLEADRRRSEAQQEERLAKVAYSQHTGFVNRGLLVKRSPLKLGFLLHVFTTDELCLGTS